MKISLTQKARRLDNDIETVIGLYLNRINGGPGVLLESAEVDGRWGRYSLAAGDFLMTANCRAGRLELAINDERLAPLAAYDGLPYLEGLRKVMAALELNPDPDMPDFPPITRGLYGYLGYGAAGLMENKLRPVLEPQYAEGAFSLAGTVYLFDHSYNQLAKLSLLPQDAASEPSAPEAFAKESAAVTGPARTSLSREQYVRAVEDIKELIRTGEAMQVVLAAQFSAPFKGDLFDVYRRLRRINPSSHLFFLRLPGYAMAVSSPEVMIRSDRGRLRLCPMAGTRPRGRTSGEDNLFEADLMADPKEQSEHVMLVDLGRNDLGRAAAPGTVKVDRFMEVERFSHVMHLTSYLSAQLDRGRDAVDVIAASFPAGTLSGAPKIRAMEIIAEFETAERGAYGGCLGWLGLDKDSVSLDLGLTIRGAWTRDETIFWQAGAGVVRDSDPDNEWKECLHKAEAVKAAIGLFDDTLFSRE